MVTMRANFEAEKPKECFSSDLKTRENRIVLYMQTNTLVWPDQNSTDGPHGETMS